MGPEQVLASVGPFPWQPPKLGGQLLTPESFALPAKQDSMWLAFAVLSSYKGRPEER